jgi:hypothetical protein
VTVGRDRRGYALVAAGRAVVFKNIFTEDREESLRFLYQRQKQSLLGNLVGADTKLFVSFATFC